MNQVFFEEDDNRGNSLNNYPGAGIGESQSFLVKILIGTGLLKDDRQANLFLVIIAVIALVIAVFLMYRMNTSSIGNNMVVAPDGRSWTVDEYINLVRQGRDPLNN